MLTLAVFTVGAKMIWAGRADAWLHATTATENLIVTLKSEISRNLVLLDLSLQGAADALAEPGITSVSPRIFQQAVFDRSASAEDVASILVLDASGNITYASQHFQPPLPNLADRDYFQVHRERRSAGLFISKVYESRLRHGDLSIALSRRLHDVDGEFTGVVMGAVRLDHFSRLFQALDLGPHGSITLFNVSGHIIDQFPFKRENLNRDLSGTPNFRQMDKEQGQLLGISSLDQRARLFTYARVPGTPLLVAVSMSVEDIYASWWRKAIVNGGVLLALCLATLTMTLLFSRENQRRAEAEARLVASAQRVAVLASTDSLTGLLTRREMTRQIDQLWEQAAQTHTHLAVLMIDVDHFKLFNDRYGHPEGDAALRSVAACLRANIRNVTDPLGRYGGEEFVAVLSGATAEIALTVAERICRAVAAELVPHTGSPCGYVTVSIGVAAMVPPEGTLLELIKSADIALYEAKRTGRNRAVAARATAGRVALTHSEAATTA